ncbi:MAG TPA: hypothetical protein VJ111_02750 [Chitinophagaceae bacterium]|nr:hypothetical protein [Chitinophagaceae bacterium]
MSRFVSSLTVSKKNLQGTLILFSFIIIGVSLLMIAAVIINQIKGPLAPELKKYHITFIWTMAALSFICLFAAKRVFNKGITGAKKCLNPLNDKLNQYRSALIRYLVICELPVSLSIILFLFTGNFIFEVYAAIFLGFMLAVAPMQRRVIAELELDWQQQKELE